MHICKKKVHKVNNTCITCILITETLCSKARPFWGPHRRLLYLHQLIHLVSNTQQSTHFCLTWLASNTTQIAECFHNFLLHQFELFTDVLHSYMVMLFRIKLCISCHRYGTQEKLLARVLFKTKCRHPVATSVIHQQSSALFALTRKCLFLSCQLPPLTLLSHKHHQISMHLFM